MADPYAMPTQILGNWGVNAYQLGQNDYQDAMTLYSDLENQANQNQANYTSQQQLAQSELNPLSAQQTTEESQDISRLGPVKDAMANNALTAQNAYTSDLGFMQGQESYAAGQQQQRNATYDPFEEQTVNTGEQNLGAMNSETASMNPESYAAQGIADAQQQAGVAAGTRQRQLEGMGLNPNSGAFAQYGVDTANATALARAGAGTQGRIQGQQTQYGQQGQLAQMGQNEMAQRQNYTDNGINTQSPESRVGGAFSYTPTTSSSAESSLGAWAPQGTYQQPGTMLNAYQYGSNAMDSSVTQIQKWAQQQESMNTAANNQGTSNIMGGIGTGLSAISSIASLFAG